MTDRPDEVPSPDPTSGTEPIPPLDWATPQPTAGAATPAAEPVAAGGAASAQRTRPPWQRWAAGGGLVLAGVLAGAGLTVALGGNDDTVNVRDVASHGRNGQGGQGQQGQGQLPGLPDGGGYGDNGRGGFPDGGIPGGGGGLAGEQRVMGTVSALTDKTVTVTVSGQATTYTLTTTSQVVVDGKTATIADVKKGDQVLVHVYPSSDGAMVVERLYAGTLPQRGGIGDQGSGTGSTTSSGAAQA